MKIKLSDDIQIVRVIKMKTDRKDVQKCLTILTVE